MKRSLEGWVEHVNRVEMEATVYVEESEAEGEEEE
jgi:hypothetical protein